MRTRVLVILLLCSVCTLTAAAGARAQQGARTPSASQLPSIPPREVVRRTVENELKAGNDDKTRYMYRDWRQTPDGSRTKVMVETNSGTVAYLVAVNDKPLNNTQRSQEEQRLQALLSNPDEQNRKKKEQQQDSDRVSRMFRQLPNAFIYQYDGMVPGSNGHEWVRLKFTPDPNYNPPSRETSVFKAMDGTMVIDPTVNRLVKIQATLFRDVTFGWGILGHLDKGGHFIVEQADIGHNRWEPTYMNIQFTGKALLFKTINLRQVEKTSDYVQVPDNLSLAQGIDMLKKHAEGALAANGSAGR